MWPASETSASDPVARPTASSTPKKPATRPKATASRHLCRAPACPCPCPAPMAYLHRRPPTSSPIGDAGSNPVDRCGWGMPEDGPDPPRTQETPAMSTSSTVDHPAVDHEQQERPLAIGLLVGGLIGLVASAVLLIERIRLAEDSAYVPTCSINPVLSCGNVMESAQAALLGFPNPIIGVAAFPVVVATGAALLAGGRLARWYWLGLQAGVTTAFAF